MFGGGGRTSPPSLAVDSVAPRAAAAETTAAVMLPVAKATANKARTVILSVHLIELTSKV
jgi:hypothetical protein